MSDRKQLQESGSSQCGSCGEDLYGAGQEYRNAFYCQDCFWELAEGVIPAPLNNKPRGKVRDLLGGERKYHGGRFYNGEW